MDKITEEKIAAAAKSFANGATLKEVRGITNDELEAVYSLGFGYYTTGKFEGSAEALRVPCPLRPPEHEVLVRARRGSAGPEGLPEGDCLVRILLVPRSREPEAAAARGGVLSRARRQGERGERDNGARALLPGEHGPRTRIPRQGRRAPQGDRRGRIQGRRIVEQLKVEWVKKVCNLVPT